MTKHVYQTVAVTLSLSCYGMCYVGRFRRKMCYTSSRWRTV